MNRLLLLGLNHTTAPLAVRERLAFSSAQREEAIGDFKARFTGAELVLISTCNRVELYVSRAVHERPTTADLVEFLARFHGVAPTEFEPYLYNKAQRDVVEHIFNVTASLDSMVLGETQILGQVRDAYETSTRCGVAGGVLHPLFQRAIAVGKQVIHDTPLAEGRVSVASVAVDYARQIFERFQDKTVLCLGAGNMAALVLQGLVGLQPGRLIICNRSPEKAVDLASQYGGEAVPFAELADRLVEADIVLTSTGAARPVITRAMFEPLLRQRRYRSVFLIDVAVPRDVEPSVGELDHVYLYNLDDLQQVVLSTRSQREGAVDAARQIVSRQVDEFVIWHRQRELGPSIHRLYSRYHEVAQDEVSRTVKKLGNVSPAERAHMEDLGRRIVNKLLHDPVQILRHSGGGHASNAQYLHAIEKLFQLSEPTDETAPPPDTTTPDTTPSDTSSSDTSPSDAARRSDANGNLHLPDASTPDGST